jgi:hypothetical protein
MKRILLVLIVFIGFQGFSQAFEAFNFTGSANANGWATHSGTTPGQVQTMSSPSNNGSSLSYLNLLAPVGNRVQLIAGNTEDVNKAVINLGTSAYYSFLLNVPTTTGLHINANAGDYFIGFGATAGASVTSLGARVFIKAGATPNTFVLGLTNNSGTGTNQTWNPTEYPCGTTVFIVVKLNISASPIASSMWINPTPGSVEPASTILNSSGNNAMVALASVYLRQGGTTATGTGTLEIDEIRAGTTWASVTPAAAASCITYNTITTTACTSYTLNAQTYSTSGTYIQTLANANAAGCDSIINLNLTINNANGSTLNITNCGPYTLNNQTYSATGAYTQLTQNIAGCDSTITLNLTIVGSLTYYQDLDNDGYGNAAVSQSGCAAITGYVTNSSDCNDNNNAIYPGAVDVAGNGIDEDCNGFDAPLQLGIYQFTGTLDCATQDVVATNTSASWTFSDFTAQGNVCESGVGIFNRSDWNLTSFINLNQYNEFSITGANCTNLNLSKLALNHRASTTGGTPTIFVRSSLDNFATDIDTIATSWNGNVLLTDTIILPATFSNLSSVTFRFYVINQATSGSALRMDNVSLWGNTISVTPTLFYADADNDGFGDLSNDSLSCSAPAGYVANSTDCNDTDVAINPNTVWYMDMDGDLQGDLMSTFTGCTPPSGYVLNSGDCDDTNPTVAAPTMYYVDADNDGFGDDATGILTCIQPANTVTIGGDCNDANNTIYPGATEICDGFDNNCNGTNDEGLIFNTYYLDSDNDQYGAGIGLVSCEAIPLPGYVLVNGDCDDTNPNVYPGATEILANDIDENCDGVDGYLGLTDVTFTNVSLVPNPSNGSFAIQLDTEMSDVNIQITDMSGKVLFHSIMSGSILELTQTHLKAGTYLVNIQLNQQREILRLVIQ